MATARFAYDWEFVPDTQADGIGISPVSIGLVDIDHPDRGPYYAIIDGFDEHTFARRAWLVDNVLPYLPYAVDTTHGGLRPLLDHPDLDRVLPADRVAEQALAYILEGHTGPVELWADFAAHDHVCLSYLFGSMSNFPARLPMWTHDVQQEAARTSSTRELPKHTGRQHHALDDALWCAERVRFLDITAARYLAAAAKATRELMAGGPVRPSSVIVGGDAGRHPYQGSPL